MKKQRNKIKIGVDFDGVVAYNPFRIIRAPIAWFKLTFLGVKKLSFFVPKYRWEQIFWIIAHESSVFPAKGTGLLKKLSKEDEYEFHLITARFKFLSPSLARWLRRFRMTDVFASVNLNVHNKQPHEHKLEVVRRLKLDYYIEDNWDIVRFLQKKTQAKIFWIYNVTDRGQEYAYKFPYLEKALEKIVEKEIRNTNIEIRNKR